VNPLRAAALLLALAACAPLNPPAPPPDPGAAGRLVVVRSDALFDWGLRLPVRINGEPAARLRAGEHREFRLPPGVYTVGVAEREIAVAVETGKTAWFLIRPEEGSLSGFDIERLDPAAGREWTGRTRPAP